MSIYLSGIRDQLRYAIITTGSVGKAWLNRVVTLIQPAQTFIRNNLKQTGVLAASNLAMLVISEKIVARIDRLLPNQAGRDSKKPLVNRAIQVLVTGGLTTGLNVALNRALQLKFDAYILAVITTVSVASSIIWQEVKGRAKQQPLLPSTHQTVSRVANADTVYMTTGDSPPSYLRSATPRINSTPRNMQRKLSTSGSGEKPVRVKPDIPLLNFEGIKGEGADIKTSKELSRRPLTGGRDATLQSKGATSINGVNTQESVEEASSLPMDEILFSTHSALPKEVTPRETIQQLSPKGEEQSTLEESVLSNPHSPGLSQPNTPKAVHQSPSTPVNEEIPVQTTSGSEDDFKPCFISEQETLDVHDEQLTQVASQQATPREITPREVHSRTTSNQTTPRFDEDEEMLNRYTKEVQLGTSIDSITDYMDPNSEVYSDVESASSYLEEVGGSSHSMPAEVLPVEPVEVVYVKPVSLQTPRLGGSAVGFDDFGDWVDE